MRVKTYIAKVHNVLTGDSCEYLNYFTRAQAEELGGVFDEYGIDVNIAQKLCDRWTLRGKFKDKIYIYWIPACQLK